MNTTKQPQKTEDKQTAVKENPIPAAQAEAQRKTVVFTEIEKLKIQRDAWRDRSIKPLGSSLRDIKLH